MTLIQLEDVKVNSVKISNVIVDTGASATLLHYDFVKEMQIPFMNIDKRVNLKITSVSGEKLQIIDERTGILEFGKIILKHRLITSKQITPGLLTGMDLLTRMDKIRIDIRKSKI